MRRYYAAPTPKDRQRLYLWRPLRLLLLSLLLHLALLLLLLAEIPWRSLSPRHLPDLLARHLLPPELHPRRD